MSSTYHNQRPILKGVFHLLTTLGYILAFPFLTKLIPTRASLLETNMTNSLIVNGATKAISSLTNVRFALLLYLLSILGNFGSSTLFHIFPWPDDIVIYPRRLDHIMIFIKIAATYYAAIATIMPDINPLVKYTLALGSLFGIIIRIFFTKAPKYVIGLPYLLMGWSILLDPKIMFLAAKRIQTGAIIAALAGLSYTVGAYIYITKCPRIWPKSFESWFCFDKKVSKQGDKSSNLSRYMGYHELFHIFTIIGAVLFTTCIFGYGVPYYNRQLLSSLTLQK